MKKTLLLSILFGLYFFSDADNRLFTYTYQSNVSNKGDIELEVWTTFHAKKATFFRGINNRLEFEVGLGKKTQTSFYINTGLDATLNSDTTNPGVDRSFDISFSNEWKHQFTDPVANKLGTALYGEFTFGLTEIELESKLILDKQINNWLTVFNLVTEYEIEKSFKNKNGTVASGREHAFKLEFDAGAAYSFDKGFSIGLETSQQNEFTKGDRLKYCAWFLGPSLSYMMDNFSITATVMPQMAAFRNRTEGYQLDLDEFERLQARIVFSVSF